MGVDAYEQRLRDVEQGHDALRERVTRAERELSLGAAVTPCGGCADRGVGEDAAFKLGMIAGALLAYAAWRYLLPREGGAA